MQFSNTSLKNGIIQSCELLLDLGDAGISGNSTLLAQFTNLINNDAYDDVIAEILRNSGDYNWDDSNYTSFPVGTTNLVVTAGSEQSDYALPTAYDGTAGSSDASSFLRLTGVKVKDAAGILQKLDPIGERSFVQPLENIFQTPGFPKWYRLFGSSIVLYPAPLASMVTATAGLRLEFSRDKIDFVVGDTTKQPGFPSIYHYLLPLIASETWAAIKGMRQLNFITQKKTRFMQNLGWGIANKNKDLPQRITSAQSRRNPNYE